MDRECEISDLGGRCCCTCAHRLADHSHPRTDKGTVTHQRGWICAPPDFRDDTTGGRHAFSGWFEHGMCECHDFKAELAADEEG